ncbi:zeta toxin family protein [Pseudomonas canadensis]|uniref:zeta toxin family protein n=1 Tax=Pseudomonas canadensis TaxID=915099 RepID=UPI003B9E33EB
MAPQLFGSTLTTLGRISRNTQVGTRVFFSGGVTVIVERTLDLVYQQRQSFLLDGTLANLDVARKNIQRALDKGNRTVQVIYVYQKPELAWEFVLAREAIEGRNIPCNEFARQF